MFKKLFATALSLGLFAAAQAEHYNVGTFLVSAPYVFLDENGLPTGFDIDIIHAIAEDQGLDYELNVRRDDVSKLFTDLEEEKVDILIASISITPERQEKYDFTEPYITDYRAILYADPNKSVTKFDDLLPLKVAAIEGSADYHLLEQSGGNPVAVTSRFVGLKKLVKGKEVDLILGDENVIKYVLKVHPGIGVSMQRLETDEKNPSNPMGILVRKGDKELLDKLNAGLKNIRANGKYDEIVTEWL